MRIGIVMLDKFGENEINEFVKDNCTLDIKVGEQKSTPYNSAEWFLPAAVMIYITKSFFDSFFKEAGKDAYILFRNSFLKLIKGLKENNEPTIYISTNKQSEARTLDVYYRINNGKFVLKFMFDSKLTTKEQAQALEELFSIIHPENEDALERIVSDFDEQCTHKNFDILVEYSKEEGWRFIDIYKRIMELKNKSQIDIDKK